VLGGLGSLEDVVDIHAEDEGAAWFVERVGLKE
jgi:hypothetical protein